MLEANYPLLYLFQNGNYEFSWAVNDVQSGNDYGHSEKRKGYDTAGQYHVLLPDGRTQTVQYSVDPYSGFQARVIYDGKPQEQPFTPASRPESSRALTYSPYRPSPAPSAQQTYSYAPPPKSFAPTSLVPRAPKPAFRSPTQSPRVYASRTLAPYKYRQAKTFEPAYNPVTPSSVVSRLPSAAPTASPFSPHRPAAASRFNPRARQNVHPQTQVHGHKVQEPVRGHGDDNRERTIEEMKKDDPFLRTEDELQGRDFDEPFFYPRDKNLLKPGKKIKDTSHDHDRRY